MVEGSCNPKYKHISLESFGNRKEVTEVLLKQLCGNNEYLFQQVKDLWDMTDPEIRKRFTPILQDNENSFGTVFDEGRSAYKFSSQTGFNVNTTFKNLDLIDIERSDAYFDTVNGIASLFPKVAAIESNSTKCFNEPSGAANAFWYIGFNKSKAYKIKAAWKKNPKSKSIPAVCRAQSFTCKKSGLLYAITMRISGKQTAEDKLYAELRTVNSHGSPTTTVLATATHKFNKTSGGEALSFTFPSPVRVKENTQYAIVLRSPFTSWNKRYSVGGWGVNCYVDRCPGGTAFLSENNGHSWIKYGKKENVPYKQGKNAPVDFAYKCHIRPDTPEYTINEDKWVYFKPIMVNPVKEVRLSTTDDIEPNTSIVYQVSANGKTWHTVNGNNAWTYKFSAPYPLFVFVRAKLRTSNKSNTPRIRQVAIHCDCEEPKEAYCRSMFYSPPMFQALGFSLWSAVNAPFETEPNTSVGVDIVRDINILQHISIIEYSEIVNYLPEEVAETIRNNEDGKNYIDRNPEFEEELREANTYLKDRVNDPSSDWYQKFILDENPVYPMLNVVLTPTKDSSPTWALSEFIDYEVDYNENTLQILQSSNLGNLPSCTLEFEYNPCWIKDVRPEEMPLKMDLFKESFVAVENQESFQTRVVPSDPIRKVLVNEDTNEVYELIEDEDFTVDYENKVILFNKPLDKDDKISIRYTPFLPDTGLALAYRMSRESINNQAYILGNYFDYRV